MKRSIIALGLLIATAACTDPAVTPTSSQAPSTSSSTTTAEALPTGTDRIPFTDLLVLDVVQPGVGGPWPVVVLVHGGGWVGGERADITDLGALMAAGGILVFNIAYRTITLGGSYPAAYEDIACGIRFARATAAEYGGDPDRLALVGYSAGAHLGAVVALAGDDFSGDCVEEEGSALPDAFVGVAGPYDSDQFSPLLIPFFGGTRADVPATWAAGNPYSYVDRRVGLPIHLLHGTSDGTVAPEFTADFAAALQAAGHSVELTMVEGAGHRDMVDPAGFGSLVVEAVLEASG